MKIYFLLFIGVLIISLQNVETRRRKRNKKSPLQRFSKGLDDETIQTLKRYECKPEGIDRKAVTPKRGIQKWKEVLLKCRDLAVNHHPSVYCGNRCIHPETCKRMKAKPMTWGFEFADGRNSSKKFEVRLPVACQCVPRKKTRN